MTRNAKARRRWGLNRKSHYGKNATKDKVQLYAPPVKASLLALLHRTKSARFIGSRWLFVGAARLQSDVLHFSVLHFHLFAFSSDSLQKIKCVFFPSFLKNRASFYPEQFGKTRPHTIQSVSAIVVNHIDANDIFVPFVWRRGFATWGKSAPQCQTSGGNSSNTAFTWRETFFFCAASLLSRHSAAF